MVFGNWTREWDNSMQIRPNGLLAGISGVIRISLVAE